MTEASRGDAGDEPVFPPGRYGRRRSGRRRSVWISRWLPLLLGGSLGLAVAVVAFQRYGNPTFRPAVTGYDFADDHVTVRFEVRKPANRTAVCRVRARARTGEEVGAADVTVPVGNPVTVVYTLPTSAKPVTAEVPTCRAPR